MADLSPLRRRMIEDMTVRIPGAFGRTRHCCRAGTRGDQGGAGHCGGRLDTRLPVDARASLMVLGAASGCAVADGIDRETDRCAASLERGE